MKRSDLIEKVSTKFPQMAARDIEKAVEVVFEEITRALSAGDRVELRGFGAFSVRFRDPRVGRNPRTGETVDVDGKFVPFFKAGKGLRDRLNKNAA